MYKLCVFIPESHLQKVKDAMFSAGAGKIGNYDHCCWQTHGQGQFRPLPDSQPHIGTIGEIEFIDEVKVELVVSNEQIKTVIESMKLAHPYEEPAYDAWQLAEL